MITSRITRPPGRHRRGSVAVIYAMVLIPIIGFAGLALDLSFAYTRRTEMQSVADAAAMAAARALNGTMAGIAAAKIEARTMAERQKYSFGKSVVWNDAALRFSDSPDKPDADWLPAGAVNAASVTNLYYAKVDTLELGDAHATVEVVFTRVLGGARETLQMAGRAIAGRTSIQVTPLAVCAISDTRVTSRDIDKGGGIVEQEVLNHGFRRGVSYNLLNMNPHGPTAVSYLVNPLDFPDQLENLNHRSLPVVRPFVCSGSIAASNLRTGSRLFVANPFPPALITEINSRFSLYTGSACNKVPAPPDANIKQYNAFYFGWWMNASGTINGSAASHPVGTRLLTIADETAVVTGVTNAHYGPLWAYSRAARYNSAAPDGVGANFPKDDWRHLYPVTSGDFLESSHSDGVPPPYIQNAGMHRTSPPVTGIRQRRVLNVPLLACPVTTSSATVLAIGRFFMASQAVNAATPAVHGEFGGLVGDDELAATVGLYK